MSEQEKELRLEGIVHAARYDPADSGKQFLGAEIQCSDGMTWVIDYQELSPFHAFAGLRVVVSGQPYQPGGQHLGGPKLGHLRVSTMRLADAAPGAELMEVGTPRQLRGRFESTRESDLCFVAETGDSFLVANDPPGLNVGRSMEVLAYPVQPPPTIQRPAGQYLWIICPCSAEDLSKWRARRLNDSSRKSRCSNLPSSAG